MSINTAQTVEDFIKTYQERYPRELVPAMVDQVDRAYFGDAGAWTGLLDHELGGTSLAFTQHNPGSTEILNVFAAATRFIKIKQAVFVLTGYDYFTIAMFQHPTLNYVPVTRNFREVLAEGSPELQAAEHWSAMPNSVHIDRMITDIGLIARQAELLGIQAVFTSWSETTYDYLIPKHLTLAPLYDSTQPAKFVQELKALL